MKKEHSTIIKKKIIALISFIAAILIMGFLSYFLVVRFSSIAYSETEFKNYIQSFGIFGIAVAFAIQVVQVILAFIPGEFVEIGIGYAYGWFFGTLLCLAGVSTCSVIIFSLVKKFGIRFVELFVSTDKINKLRIINSEKKLKTLTFLLYFIPGTPKDLLTYFMGLTRITTKQFLAITLFARIPSVLTSTFGGNMVGKGNYIGAVLMFLITAIISIAGAFIYKIILKKIHKQKTGM